jgi:hypothetical protein
VSLFADGTKAAISTLSYANGNGFKSHHLGAETNSINPWKDVSKANYEDIDYLQPAMMPGFDGYETHGGEDVAIFAAGDCY